MVWMALLASVLAGEVVVALDTPVVVYIDGQLMDIDGGQASADALVAGRHLVQVRNLVGQLVAEMNLEVPVDQQVRLRYGARQLTLIGSGPLPTAAAPATPTAPAEAAPPASGSLEIAGFNAQTGGVWVDAVRVAYDAGSDSFPARGLSPGLHELRVEKDHRVAYKGALEVRAGQNQRCLLEPNGRMWSLDCFFERSGAEPAAPVPPTPTAPVAVAAPPVAEGAKAGNVNVEWVLKDPMDMCNVYVDGARVAEFRTGDRKRDVTLAPGVHTVEIRDFTEFETWHRGVLTVSGPDALRVGFGEEEPVEVYNRVGAWRDQ